MTQQVVSSLDPTVIAIRQWWYSRARKINRRAKSMRAKGTVTRTELILKFEEYDEACAYCGIKVIILYNGIGKLSDIDKARTLTFDHVVALGNGGTNTIDNIVPACYYCNHTKDDA